MLRRREINMKRGDIVKHKIDDRRIVVINLQESSPKWFDGRYRNLLTGEYERKVFCIDEVKPADQ